MFADQQGAWDGILPDTRNTPVRVEAAAYAGSPVSFEIITPSREGTSAVASRSATTNGPLLLYAAIFVLSLLLVRHNLRLGRADRRGAFRTAALMAVATLAGRLLVTDDTSELVPFVGSGLALALWAAVVPWTFYIALEPYVRRVWPEMLIGWSRLISGRVRDPLIGRDVLVGIVGGIAVAALVHLRVLVPGWLGFPPPSPLGSEGSRAAYLLAVANGPGAIVALPLSLTNSLFIGLLSAITLVLLTMLLRGRGRAAVAWVVIWTVANQVPSPGDPIADLAYKALTFSIAIVLLIRFGLLTSVVHLITTSLLVAIELRFDAVAPHSAAAYMLIGAIAVLALYGFHTALAGQSVFGTVLLKEDST